MGKAGKVSTQHGSVKFLFKILRRSFTVTYIIMTRHDNLIQFLPFCFRQRLHRGHRAGRLPQGVCRVRHGGGERARGLGQIILYHTVSKFFNKLVLSTFENEVHNN